MVARIGGYYRDLFKGQHGVTQRNPFYPKQINVMVDAVLRHWVLVSIEVQGEYGQEGFFGRDVKRFSL